MATKKSQVLSDRFLVGEELGRGAYGQVYKGIDYKTGDTVAIKQISLAGIPTDNLHSVMGEIELLKTLNHKNIVKYIGSFKTRTHLYIILEYMENGSLASIIKPNKFGTFPESLVAVYIAQVLQGLQYLHDQVGGAGGTKYQGPVLGRGGPDWVAALGWYNLPCGCRAARTTAITPALAGT